MAGHSHAKNVMHKKAAMDKKKAKIFMKNAKAINIAIKLGNSNNPEVNPKLRLALKIAQNANVPKDIIKKLLDQKEDYTKKFDEILYEGYYYGVAILALALTNNQNKTAPEIRFIFNKANASLGSSNSVNFMFDKVAIIECEVDESKYNEFFEDALIIGAQNIEENIAYFPQEKFHLAQTELEKKWKITLAELSYIPNTIVSECDNVEGLESFIERLEENESIQGCWHNYREKD